MSLVFEINMENPQRLVWHFQKERLFDRRDHREYQELSLQGFFWSTIIKSVKDFFLIGPTLVKFVRTTERFEGFSFIKPSLVNYVCITERFEGFLFNRPNLVFT